MTLSTTEPNNYVGIIKVRKGDTESQVFDVTITENSKPKDLTGLTPFFCVKSGPHTGLGLSEQLVTEIVDAKAGKLRYTLTEYDMQYAGVNHGYFSFRLKQEDMSWRQQFSTKEFNYTVMPSIFIDGIKDSNYIWTFEEILRYFQEWVKTCQETYDDWYIKAQEELERIIAEFQGWIKDNQTAYEKWVKDNQDAYTSWINSHQNEFQGWADETKKVFYDWFESIKSILDDNVAGNLQNQIDTIKPTKEVITIEHDFKGYPRIRVLYGEYGMGVVGIATEPTGLGGNNLIEVTPGMEYLDKNSFKVKIPQKFLLVDPEVIIVDSKTVRLIDGYKALHIELIDGELKEAYYLKTLFADFVNKTANNASVPHVYSRRYAIGIEPVNGVWVENTQSDYTNISKLDNSLSVLYQNAEGMVPQAKISFNLLKVIKNRYPYLFIPFTSIDEEVALLRKYIILLKPGIYAFGVGVVDGTAKNQLHFKVGTTRNTWDGTRTTNSATPVKLEYSLDVGNVFYISDDGWVHTIAYSLPSNGDIQSKICIDYASLEYTIKIGGVA